MESVTYELIDSLVLHIRSILDDGLVHALTDDRDIVSRNSGQRNLTEVVCSVWQEDTCALSSAAVCIGKIEHSEEVAAVAWLADIISEFVLLS